MAVINPPGWLQNVGATHTAAQLRSYIGALIGQNSSGTSMIAASGVHPDMGNKLSVTQNGSPNMSVIVKSGIALVGGTENASQGSYFVMNDADLNLSIGANGSGQPRIDSVFFKVQDTQYSGVTDACSLVVVAGTPAGSPSPPSAPANAIRLANVAVANGASSITNANITDVRPWLTVPSYTMPQVDVFTSGGTWTKPAGARWVWARVQAAGGGSGGCALTSAGQSAASGGGGGGGYCEKWIDASTLNATEAVTVGSGGAGGASGNNNGSTGGNSTFKTLTANGGAGGTGSASSASNNLNAGGNGGGSSGGDFALDGGDAPNGIIGSSGMVFCQSPGGSSYFGSSQRPSSSSSASGQTGNTYGGGAAGGSNQPSQSAVAGGTGGGGLVVITTIF